MKKNEYVLLTAEKETLFITLYAKAIDYRARHSILRDKWANDLLSSVSYDFSKIKVFGNSVSVVRARHIDDWTKAFIQTHPDAVIVYMGCGLDARVFRVDPPTTVSWYDVDYPEVIDLRSRLYPPRPGYRMIASSLTVSGWLEQIPTNRPTLILAEGVLEYIREEDVQTLLNRLTNHFGHGQLIFDVMNSFAIRSGKETLKKTFGTEHKWAVDDVLQVDRLNTAMTRKDCIHVFTSPYRTQLPFKERLFMRVFTRFSNFRNMIRVLRYEF